MVAGIAKEALQCIGALEIELDIVLCGNTDTAMQLNTAAGVKEKRLTAVGLSDARRLRKCSR